MIAIRTNFDGKKIVVPEELRGIAPTEVILVIERPKPAAKEKQAWTRAQEPSFAKVWNNDEDAIYDNL